MPMLTVSKEGEIRFEISSTDSVTDLSLPKLQNVDSVTLSGDFSRYHCSQSVCRFAADNVLALIFHPWLPCQEILSWMLGAP
jgi:hypothetical protein